MFDKQTNTSKKNVSSAGQKQLFIILPRVYDSLYPILELSVLQVFFHQGLQDVHGSRCPSPLCGSSGGSLCNVSCPLAFPSFHKGFNDEACELRLTPVSLESSVATVELLSMEQHQRALSVKIVLD